MRLGIVPGLQRMNQFVYATGHPELKMGRVVLVGGTNGKGSTCAFLDSVLTGHGVRTVRFNSPHLSRFEERYLIQGCQASPKVLDQVAGQVFDIEKRWGIELTGFELATAVAFLLFAEEAPEVAIVEVGMGGRLDATNVVNPALSIITPVALDHMAFLGNTPEAIALEKAGIMRQGAPTIVAEQSPEVLAVLQESSRTVGANAIFEDADFAITSYPETPQSGWRLRSPSRQWSIPKLGLFGKYQGHNALLALIAAEILLGNDLDEGTVTKGLTEASWPGRFDRRRFEDTEIIFDGAHNPHALEHLAQAVKEAGLAPLPVLYGAKADKDVDTICRILPSFTNEVWLTTPPGIAAHDPVALGERLAAHGVQVHVFEDPDEAFLAFARSDGATVRLCCGSLYLVGYLLRRFELSVVS